MTAINIGVGRSFARALADLVEHQTEVRTSVLAQQLSSHRPQPTAKRIGRRLLDMGWTARVISGGRHVYVSPTWSDHPLHGPGKPIGAAQPAPEDNLGRQGLRLEAAASTANGLRGRANAAAIGDAVEQLGLERDAFRAMLHARTGIPAERLEQWLAL